ncbi:MAG: RNA polymerase sigma factor [Sandaracinaceae bacterium]|nr:RNA polymerase sigma factor [Sandaracinaceae bacterium]
MDEAERWRAIQALHPACFAWARACAPEDAEDVLQTAYEKILSGRARFDARSSLKTWVFGVIRVTALEHRRSAWRRALRLVPLSREPAAPHDAPPEDASRVLAALARLSERQRQVLHLVFYEDLTIEEAARAIGIGLGSARTHYERGKRRLSELLEEGAER